MSYLKVCCAVIRNGENFLAVQRSSAMTHPSKWEFPGGKIEAGESAENTLIREIREELSAEIEIIQPLTPVKFNYSEKSIELIPFLVSIQNDQIQLSEHQDYVWLKKDKLKSLDWVEADIAIVKEITDSF